MIIPTQIKSGRASGKPPAPMTCYSNFFFSCGRIRLTGGGSHASALQNRLYLVGPGHAFIAWILRG
jgi:hypothetical protein